MKKIKGNTLGLKPNQIGRLEKLLQRRIPPDQVITAELARAMCQLSRETGRQLGVLVDRKGKIRDLLVGDARQIEISELGRYRAGRSRFRGLRYLHTHLKGEPLSHDDLTDLALLRFDLIGAIEAREDGLPGVIYLGHLRPGSDGQQPWHTDPPTPFHSLDLDFLAFIRSLEEEFSSTATAVQAVQEGVRRAVLVGVTTGTLEEARESMEELKDLARSADIRVVDVVIQRRNKLDKRFVVGSGKMRDLYIRCMQLRADLMVFDGELSGSQVRAISEFGDIEVWDRTQLILGIFAGRARSRGGKLQVELAMLRYSLPRLVLKDDFLSRLTGGIGARGPGETKMEVLRRRVRDRIARLEKELGQLSRERRLRRSRRQRAGVPVVSIVGYTNAGKSTLLNTLTGSNITAEHRLFATLDPTSRRLHLPGGGHVILTDTVGFIRELPDDLAAAFKATLEELNDADLLLHLVDVSNLHFPQQILAVDRILADLALDNIPVVVIFNKADLVSDERLAEIRTEYPYPCVSALEPDSLVPMLAAVEEALLTRKVGLGTPELDRQRA